MRKNNKNMSENCFNEMMDYTTYLKTSSLFVESGKIVGDNGDSLRIFPVLLPKIIVELTSDNTKNECQ